MTPKISRLQFVTLIGLLVVACGPSGNTNVGADLAGTVVEDLAGVDLTGADLTMTSPPDFAVVVPPDLKGADLVPYTGPDIATPGLPDLLGLNTRTIDWRLENCNNYMNLQCGFAGTCGSFGLTSLRFTVTNETDNATADTVIPCPSGSSTGKVTIALPGVSTGRWTFQAFSDQNATTRSRIMCHLNDTCFASGVTSYVYGVGCDDPVCTTCDQAIDWCG